MDYLIAILIFLFSFGLTKKNYFKAILLIIFFIPFQHKEIFSFVLNDLLIVRLLLLGYIAAKITQKNFLKTYFKNKEYKDYFLICLFVLYLLRCISLIFATDKSHGLNLLAFFEVMVLFYVFLKDSIKDKSSFTKVLKMYVFTSFILSIFVYVQIYFYKILEFKIGGIWENNADFLPRLGSTFWDVNHYGAYLTGAIPLALYFLINSKIFKYKLLYFLGFLSLIFNLYLTQSRSAWLGFFVSIGLISLLFILKGYKKLALYCIGIVSIFTFLIILYLQFFTEAKAYDSYRNFMHKRLDSFNSHFTF